MADRSESLPEKPNESDDPSSDGAQALSFNYFNVGNKNQTEVSKKWIMGKFVNEKEQLELLISYSCGDLTIRKKQKSEVMKVNRVSVMRDSGTNSSGEHVEVGEFSDKEVFKKYYMRGGRGENEVEIEEYRIENPQYRPTHSSKLLGVQVFKFVNVEGVEKVKVDKTCPIPWQLADTFLTDFKIPTRFRGPYSMFGNLSG